MLLATGTDAVPQNLRATMIFRKEDGRWKIVHSHADFPASSAGSSPSE